MNHFLLQGVWYKIIRQSPCLPCWKSVLPQPLMSRASPVKTMLWSSNTSDTHPSVWPGVSLTIRRCSEEQTEFNTRHVKNILSSIFNSDSERGADPKCICGLNWQVWHIFSLKWRTHGLTLSNVFILHVSQRWSCPPLSGGYLQMPRWMWRLRSSAQLLFSSSTQCLWCGLHGSGCLLCRKEKKDLVQTTGFRNYSEILYVKSWWLHVKITTQK